MLSLSQKTVVVTRPREQAAELKFELEKYNAKVVLFPTIEIVAPADNYAELDAAIQSLSAYDWLVATSVNAADHFLQRLEANDQEISELDFLRICAVGEATFERFRAAQVHVDILPDKSSAEGVFATLTEYLGAPTDFKNVRFLLPRSSIAKSFLPNKLREVGAEVREVTAYQTILPIKSEVGKIKAFLQGGAIDCLTFTSPSTFDNFIELLGADSFSQFVSEDVAIACLGETTACAVRNKNLFVDIVADNANASSFAAAIADFYRKGADV